MTRKALSVRLPARKLVPGLEEALAIGPLIGRVRSIALSAMDAELQPFGITGMQFAILRHLADGVAQTAADLSRLMHYDTGSMTRMLDRLEEQGWVHRERSRDDRRVVHLGVTAAGRDALPRVLDSAAGVLQRMLIGFNETEVKDLHGFLTRMIDNGELRAPPMSLAEGKR